MGECCIYVISHNRGLSDYDARVRLVESSRFDFGNPNLLILCGVCVARKPKALNVRLPKACRNAYRSNSPRVLVWRKLHDPGANASALF